MGVFVSFDDEFIYYIEFEDNVVVEQDFLGLFGGIGVMLVVVNSDGFGGKVDNVFKDNFVFKGGVYIGDVFFKIGDKDVMGVKFNDIVKLVCGFIGLEVDVIFGCNGKFYIVKFKCDKVNVISVEKIILFGNIGYVVFNIFYNEQVSVQFCVVIVDMKKVNVQKLIFDLCDNGGGLLSVGVDVVDQFL